MLNILFYVILAIVGSNAYFTSDTEVEIFPREPRMAAGTAVTDPDNTAAIAFLFTAATPDTATWIGNGIVINKYYVVTVVDLTAYMIDPPGLNAVVHCLDIANCLATGGTGQQRHGREVLAFDATNCATDPTKCLWLLRICPSFPSDVTTIPVASDFVPYKTPGTAVNLYQFNAAGALEVDNKLVAEYCECFNLPLYVVNYHICVANDITYFGETADETKGLVVSGADAGGLATEYVGFLYKSQVDDGELVLWLGHADYTNFLTVTADPNAWEYP